MAECGNPPTVYLSPVESRESFVADPDEPMDVHELQPEGHPVVTPRVQGLDMDTPHPTPGMEMRMEQLIILMGRLLDRLETREVEQQIRDGVNAGRRSQDGPRGNLMEEMGSASASESASHPTTVPLTSTMRPQLPVSSRVGYIQKMGYTLIHHQYHVL